MSLSKAEIWTIDEVAQKAGCSVDTIRFYTRQGLLPEIERKGRSLLYGPPHLERLRQIQSLQRRHFSLASIKDLADEGRLDLLERIFALPERSIVREELTRESGLSGELVDQLEALGFLPGPKERGGAEFDGSDLRALRSVGDLLSKGMPPAVLAVLVRLYTQQMAVLKRKLLTTFMDWGNMPNVTEQEVDAFITLASTEIDDFIETFDQLVQYLHRRALQTLIVDALEMGEDERLTAGG